MRIETMYSTNVPQRIEAAGAARQGQGQQAQGPRPVGRPAGYDTVSISPEALEMALRTLQAPQPDDEDDFEAQLEELDAEARLAEYLQKKKEAFGDQPNEEAEEIEALLEALQSERAAPGGALLGAGKYSSVSALQAQVERARLEIIT
ncbi:hypothetical protein [Desulfovibrio cuneatus]|uniref:hypothetical protein n=1 Tax=Desulfovibrio cuneatus TaxID=159728 RepID=UPI00041B764C|nr:hypothetical protein [Desulfovibrio cuneatus]